MSDILKDAIVVKDGEISCGSWCITREYRQGDWTETTIYHNNTTFVDGMLNLSNLHKILEYIKQENERK